MKKNKLFLLTFSIFCVLFVLANSRLFAGGAPRKELFFGPVVSELEGTGLIAAKTQGQAVSLNRTALSGGKQKTIHFSLDANEVSLNTVRGRDYLKIEGLKPYGNPNQPQLPFKSFMVTLPLNSELQAVAVSDVSYRPVLNKLDIVSHPMPVSRVGRVRGGKQTANAKGSADGSEKGTANVFKSYSACRTCDTDSFFPGNIISYDTGKDNHNRYVFIKFFPVQYTIGSKHAVLIDNAEITVNYQLINKEFETNGKQNE